ncbi:hypothetical protein FisN_17Lh026 [Fistulifera solaris]|uniref:NADH dehydrogenase [ubiquinone] iron-sulfur protein 4, mitochondrial n=1 Tax=Fistulifera solaris TaxID=1519565 RepID=A0A1Z5J5R8_FISSO|nr:hypothetical protein FisN_17Lh026 [Fistulifera solaris]|eukprot:GAX09279.1 hypothetical protein FisN_17Lh026 [Fistulifera solaris]
MLTAYASRTIRRSSVARLQAANLAVPVPKKEGEEEQALSPAAATREKMSNYDRHMVWGHVGEEGFPVPVLPEKPAEIALLDPADHGHRVRQDGTARTVVIRQQKKSARQAPLNPEASWKIYFYEDGTYSEKWTNSLMGWTSNADPYQCAPPLTFENAADAVYFAKKRGWNYVVKQPIMRYMRNDDAQYQDNFLPQAIAAKVQKEGTSCDHWKRSSAGTSHYFRPLNYHGTAPVIQHGPNGTAPIAKAPEGYYKQR